MDQNRCDPNIFGMFCLFILNHYVLYLFNIIYARPGIVCFSF